ncbi:MAG: DUF2764 domain-containing protein [Spirochaetota bacterium]|nr:DUF2764 domain-containing protein [Spirochaetota bacterium]
MPRAYYCFVAGFPDFALDDPKLPLNSKGLKADLGDILAPEDRVYLAELFYPVDNKNFLAVLLGRLDQAHDPLGAYTREELEDEVRVPTRLPRYMIDFIDQYRAGVSGDTHPENILAAAMYTALAQSNNAFIRNWFAFDRDLRNIVAALGCRRTKKTDLVEREVIGEGLVADAIRRGSGADFGLGRELVWLDALLRGYQASLLERELAIDRIRLDMLDELTVSSDFTLDRVLALVVRLGIAERWLALDLARGREMLTRILADMKSGLVFPEEFSLRIRGGSKHGDNR